MRNVSVPRINFPPQCTPRLTSRSTSTWLYNDTIMSADAVPFIPTTMSTVISIIVISVVAHTPIIVLTVIPIIFIYRWWMMTLM